MPLSIAPPNVAVEIKKICAEEKVAKHLGELGLAAGTRVKLIACGGSVIITLKEGRLCLDRELASRITVAVVRDEPALA